MPKSLLEQLPKVVANVRMQAGKILESLEGGHRVALQTREWRFPLEKRRGNRPGRSATAHLLAIKPRRRISLDLADVQPANRGKRA